jgi:serine/threonine protein kinase
MVGDEEILLSLNCKTIRLVGIGTFGRVYLVKHHKYDIVCAKIINAVDYDSREYDNLEKLVGNKHIVRIFGFVVIKYLAFFLQLCLCGSKR